jgi:hypothetical protein
LMVPLFRSQRRERVKVFGAFRVARRGDQGARFLSDARPVIHQGSALMRWNQPKSAWSGVANPRSLAVAFASEPGRWGRGARGARLPAIGQYLWRCMVLLFRVVSCAGRQPGATSGAATLCTFDNACCVLPAFRVGAVASCTSPGGQNAALSDVEHERPRRSLSSWVVSMVF